MLDTHPLIVYENMICVPVDLEKMVWGSALCDPMDSSLHQAPPSMGFSRQEYWSGLPFPSAGDLPDPGVEPDSHIKGRFFTD